MNSGSMDRPTLHVEGSDDKHCIIHLMGRHGVDYELKPWPPSFPELKEVGSVEALLAGMETAISAASGKVIGFVLDADSPLQSRWSSIRTRLERVDVVAPPIPPPHGFVGESPKFKVRVGVWLMPDNQHDGMLENFLQDLIAAHDPLIDLAKRATAEAQLLGAKFRPIDSPKATLHAWLAWQDEPGRPYGVAIRAKFFQPHLPAGTAFANWFRNLYGIS